MVREMIIPDGPKTTWHASKCIIRTILEVLTRTSWGIESFGEELESVIRISWGIRAEV